ncbi:MAG: XTP/dITP diphosphatase [Candidatus Brockarchaeota archaeon]|nr:XTP/dITP diphosphatase [Candidatus Brockarchaeota archaeon]
MKLIFVTGNPGKFLEAKELLGKYGIRLEQADIEVTEPQSDDLEEVAVKCAEEALKKAGERFIIEDSGLFVNSLNGFPGVYSSYVHRKIGCEGILRLLAGSADRSAYFMAALAYGEPGSGVRLFTGRVDGNVATEPRGKSGFGYDPLFIPFGSHSTFAEMSIEEKNKFSHRAKALKAFASWFLKKYERK